MEKSKSKKDVVEILQNDTYIALIKNSVGSKTFKNVFAKFNGIKKDILSRGGLSCAFFVSSILVIVGYISKVHTTVNGLVDELMKSGWQKTDKPKIGDVIIWGPHKDSKHHFHVGFFIGMNKAISNSSKKRTPIVHHMTFGKKGTKTYREIIEVWTYGK